MAALRIRPVRRLSRAEWIAAAATLFAIAVYLLMLRYLDHRAATYFEALRKSDPATYLINLREGKGFDAYLAEYATLEGFDTYRRQPPGFIVGRWTMHDQPLRLTNNQAPTTCTDTATFEYGRYMGAVADGAAMPVHYRLSGTRVEMKTASDEVFPIRLVAYGAQLDHLEFTPPGRTAPVYAYLCGR